MNNSKSLYAKRKLVNNLMIGFSYFSAFLGIFLLIWILGDVAIKGVSGINLAFFTQMPTPTGVPGGGMANAIVGTLMLIGLGFLFGAPVGVLAGIYLAEFGDNPVGNFIRFLAEVMSSIPSIVVGIFVYALVVVPMGGFSALSGGIALGILMIPTVTKTTEEMIRLVPRTLREASLALGVPYWKTVLKIVLNTALSGIVTGIMLAVARIGGETAPLLFTAFNNQFWSTDLTQPISSLPVQIFNYAMSPYDDWHQQAWTASLVLIVMVLFLNIGAKLFARSRSR